MATPCIAYLFPQLSLIEFCFSVINASKVALTYDAQVFKVPVNHSYTCSSLNPLSLNGTSYNGTTHLNGTFFASLTLTKVHVEAFGLGKDDKYSARKYLILSFQGSFTFGTMFNEIFNVHMDDQNCYWDNKPWQIFEKSILRMFNPVETNFQYVRSRSCSEDQELAMNRKLHNNFFFEYIFIEFLRNNVDK